MACTKYNYKQEKKMCKNKERISMIGNRQNWKRSVKRESAWETHRYNRKHKKHNNEGTSIFQGCSQLSKCRSVYNRKIFLLPAEPQRGVSPEFVDTKMARNSAFSHFHEWVTTVKLKPYWKTSCLQQKPPTPIEPIYCTHRFVMFTHMLFQDIFVLIRMTGSNCYMEWCQSSRKCSYLPASMSRRKSEYVRLMLMVGLYLGFFRALSNVLNIISTLSRPTIPATQTYNKVNTALRSQYGLIWRVNNAGMRVLKNNNSYL